MTTEAMTIETLNEWYTSILKSVNFVPDENNLVSYIIGGTKVPVQVNGKRLVLAVRSVLENPDWANTIAFHPMSEAIIRGESPVLRKLKIAIQSRLTTVATCLVTELMGIAVDHDYHKKLSPTQSEFLDLVPNVKVKEGKEKDSPLSKLEKLFDVVSVDGEHRMLSLYLKRGGEWKGKKYQRVCVVDFPLVQELKSEGTMACGVNLGSIKNKKAILALFNYVLPDAEGENYSFGSNSMAAPNLHALLTSFAKIASKLNKITKLFHKHLDNPGELHIELGFEKHLGDLAQFRDVIPSLQGNEGDVGEGSESKPHQHPAPNTSKFAQAVIDRESEAKPTVAAAPAPFVPPWENAPQQGGFNAVPAAAPAPAPAATSGGGISWNSVVAHNPALQQQNTFQQQNRFAAPAMFQQPQAFAPQPQITRGGYVQQPASGFGGQFGFNQPQPGFNQPAVMFPNGI